MDKSALLDQLSKLEILRSSLHSEFRFWEWMVVVGLGFDLLVIWKEYWGDLKDFWRHEIHPPEKPSGFLLLLAFLGTGLILYGISKELSVDSKLEKVETDTREANSKLFGVVSDEVGAIDVKAKDIEGRLRAASNLLDVIGPRSLLLERNKAAFIKDLKRFPKQRITIVRCVSGTDAAEPDELIKDLIDFLGPNGAGWAVNGPNEGTWNAPTWEECKQATVPATAGGLVLVLSDTQNVDAKQSAVDAAKALKDELKNKIAIATRIAEGTKLDNARILSEPGSFWKTAGDDPKEIFLLVGPNPQFTLNEPKKRSKQP